jgi:hypothetical protein
MVMARWLQMKRLLSNKGAKKTVRRLVIIVCVQQFCHAFVSMEEEEV